MTNDRLRTAMKARHVTPSTVAEQVGVDEKTVEKWLAGRLPHPRHRWAVAELLTQDEDVLWPAARRGATGQAAELVRLYAHRSDVPSEVWWALMSSAEREISVLAYAALFLPERVGVIDLLAGKAAVGCHVRVLLADPACSKLHERGAEEQFGEGIVSRVRVALRHYEPIAGVPGVAVRVHCTTLYNSMFRFDDTVMVNTHIWGRNAFAAPVLHVQRLGKDGLFDSYAASFEAVWASALPADFGTLDAASHDTP